MSCRVSSKLRRYHRKRAGRGTTARLGHGASRRRHRRRPADRTGLRAVPRLVQGRTEQDRSQSLGCGRPCARLASGLRLFERDECQPRSMDVRQTLHLFEIAGDDGAGNEDDVRRIEQREGAHKPARLSAHAVRQPVANSGAGTREGGCTGKCSGQHAGHTGQRNTTCSGNACAEEELSPTTRQARGRTRTFGR